MAVITKSSVPTLVEKFARFQSLAATSDQPLAQGSCRYETAPLNDRFDRAHLLQKYVGDNHRVLELGCSTGYISRLLKERGCRVVGVECDRDAARLAANICDEVVVADLNNMAWIKTATAQLQGRFDVVLMGDVLEHLVHPEEVLRGVRQFLLPGGAAIISLPNIVHWTQRLQNSLGRFDYQSTGLLDHTHLRFFTVRVGFDCELRVPSR